jgi:hypothetical protein
MLHRGKWTDPIRRVAARGTGQGKCVASGEIGDSAVGFACFENRPPNMRVQRTRFASLRSPLTRRPLGEPEA